MSRFRTDGIHITSPAGVWGYEDLIGATVRVKSRSIGSGLFSVDSSSEYLPKGEYYFSEHFGVDNADIFTIFNRLLGSSYGARFMVGDQNLAILGNGTVGMVDEVFEWEILHNSLDSSYVLIKAKGQDKYLTCYMNGITVELKVIDSDSAGIVKSLMLIAEPTPGNTPAGYEIN